MAAPGDFDSSFLSPNITKERAFLLLILFSSPTNTQLHSGVGVLYFSASSTFIDLPF